MERNARQCVVSIGYGDSLRAAIVSASSLFEAAAAGIREIDAHPTPIVFGDDEVIRVRAGSLPLQYVKVGRIRRWMAEHK